MSSEFPRLQKKLDELLWQFEKQLQATIDECGLEDVELRISEANFIPRSPVTKSAYYLREILDDCLDNSGKIIQADQIDEEHIAAAEGLLKLGKYQGSAIEVLTQVLRRRLDETTRDNLVSRTLSLKKEAEATQKQLKNLRKLASDALSKCSSEIVMFDNNSKSDFNYRDFSDEYCHPQRKVFCKWDTKNKKEICGHTPCQPN